MVAILAASFFAGLVGVVYLSLQGEELKVPEIVGKDFFESEKELTRLGLKIKKRADRYSREKQNTILEQRPKAGEIVKTGQMILVVVSKDNPDGDEAPATIETDEDEDIEKIEELITDKPQPTSRKSARKDKKKAVTTRDVKDEEKEGEDEKDSEKADDTAGEKAAGDKPAADNNPATGPPAGGEKPKTDQPAPVEPVKKPAPAGEKPKPAQPAETNKPTPGKKPPGNGTTRPRKSP